MLNALLSDSLQALGFRKLSMDVGENEDRALAVKILLLIVGALFVVMTGIGGFTAAHLVAQIDDLSARLTQIQSSAAANDVTMKDQELRLGRIEHLLDDARRDDSRRR